MSTDFERIGATLRSGVEHARRNLFAYAAIGASAIALAANAEPVGAAGTQPEPKASGLSFTPGHYEGATTQVCTAEADTQGYCTEGQNVPISFTVSKKKVSKLNTVVISDCTGDAPDVISPLKNRSSKLFENNFTVVESTDGNRVSRVQVTGIMQKRGKAFGFIEGVFNPSGKDPSDTVTCNAGNKVQLHAKLVK